MRRPFTLVALLALAPLASAGPITCECNGQAQIFAVEAGFVDLRIAADPSYSHPACRLLEGELRRVYVSRHRTAAQPLRQWLRDASSVLRDRAVGDRVGFECHLSRAGGVTEIRWQLHSN